MAISAEPLVAEREAPTQRPDRDGRFGRFGGKYVRTPTVQICILHRNMDRLLHLHR